MTKAELEERVLELTAKVNNLERQLTVKDQEIQRLKNRGAGRTPVFSEREKEKILADYNTGKTIRDTAKLNYCSVGFVHKLISEQIEKGR